jgi:class 3 adenylate cyclase/DNA polymerase III delta prime subunit
MATEPSLPTGTITFLFTDIQGSTPLWEREPEKMAAALQINNAALRQAIEVHGGVVFKTVGDAFQAAFATAPQALKAAIEGQRALQSAAWNDLGPLQVRMGLHTGEAELDPGGDEYAVSHTKNRIGRIHSVACGGQILLSQETADLVVRKLPKGVSLKDLGEHRLKGMHWLEHLFQVCIPGLEQDFPPLVTAVTHAHNLPDQRTSFTDREKEIIRAGTPLDHVVRGNLIGREHELAEALQVWRKARQGESSILLISGEPGVGKTRLAHELIIHTQVENRAVLVGECYAEGSAPYAAFAQMILNAADWAADLPQLVFADLISLAPALRVRYPDVPLNPSLDPAAEQQRLYESAFTFFARLAGSAPLLLLLEDMHWADGGTLALARSLARRFHQTRTPALMILTFREGELSEKKELGDLLNNWNRERLSNPLKLHRLDRQGTQDLVEALFAESVSAEFADGVYRETEGNPFFIEEICKALIDSGQVYRENGRWQRRSTTPIEMPRSIRMAIETRLASLPESCQEVLHLAAVLGRRFEFDMLLAAADPASQWDEEILITALEAAEQAQLLVEIGRKGAGIFEFAHALIPTTLTEGISGMRCRRLHRRAIAALEKLHPEDYKALAHHCLEASEEPRALDYLIQAAQQARAAFANAEAVANYQQALGLLNELYHGQAQDDPWRIAALPLYESLGDVLELTGQHEQAWNTYQNALALAPASEGIRRSSLYRKAGKTQESLRLYDDADQVYRQAEAALGPEPDRDNPDWWQEWVTLQLDRIYLYYWPGRVQEMMALVEKVRPAVERYGTPLQLGKLYYNIALALVRRDRYVISDEILAYVRKAVEILRETGVGSEQTFAEFHLGFELLWHGDLKEAENQLLIALQASERTGDVTTETRCLTYLAVTYRKLGDVPNVKTYAARSLEAAAIGQMIEYTGMAKANLAWAARREGKILEAQKLAEAAWETMQKTIQSQMFNWVAVWPLIGICLAQHQTAEAIDFARMLLAPTTQPQPETIASPLQAAIQAWEHGRPAQAFASLTQAVALAKPLGYL